MKISTIAGISNFIQGPLIPKLRADAKNFRIILERDLEYRIYHHITTKIDEKKFLIMGNKTISGIRTSAKKTRGTKSDSGRFVMPDIMIRDYDKPNDIRIIMELKLNKATSTPSAYHNRTADTESFEADFDNLRNYWKDPKLSKQLKHEFFIYLYRDRGELEEEIQEKIAKKLRKDIRRCPKQLIPIAINRYQKENGERYDEEKMDEINSEFKRINDIQAGRNNSKKISKKKSAVKGKDYSRNPKKAVAKMKWYRDHPKDPKSIEWAKLHPNDRYGYSKKILGKSWEKYATKN